MISGKISWQQKRTMCCQGQVLPRFCCGLVDTVFNRNLYWNLQQIYMKEIRPMWDRSETQWKYVNKEMLIFFGKLVWRWNHSNNLTYFYQIRRKERMKEKSFCTCFSRQTVHKTALSTLIFTPADLASGRSKRMSSEPPSDTRHNIFCVPFLNDET